MMKWIYGKQDWKTLERGSENCYLLTNGLGGFSSMTMTGGVTRNDHAFLMACIKAPNHRVNVVHRLKEELIKGGDRYVLSSQEFKDGETEEGFRYLSAFTYEDTPVWTFHLCGVEIIKEAAMKQGENTAVLRYEINNCGRETCSLSVTPFFQFTPKGMDMEADQKLTRRENSVESRGITLSFKTNGEVEDIPETKETYFYRWDVCDGRRAAGTAAANHRITVTAEPGETKTLEIVYQAEKSAEQTADFGISAADSAKQTADTGKDSAVKIINEWKAYRKRLKRQCGLASEYAKTLAAGAAQYVSERESTKGKTILAGFPFFEDWGRDTMIALPGICITTGQYDTAKSILRTFAVNEKNGLMPNLFPEGGNEPMYNTVDAALLFINCVYLYYEAVKDKGFVKEMYPVMERIMAAYQKGTDYGIRMDRDGLIQAGEGLAQVTWMDVCVDGILPTPRHGKPVEINAYWYNALKIMEYFSALMGGESGKDTADGAAGEADSEIYRARGAQYRELAARVKVSFAEKFWMEEKHCLKDLVSGTKADIQIRCNQIWAVSMPFTILDIERERQIVAAVFEKLYTPYGLRTLETEDEEFHPCYIGEVKERDMAYHQGTVWVFPLGAYYLSYLKVNGYSEAAKNKVKRQMEVLESAMREGCIGHLPEIYDGQNPVSSKGCFAQAWSVGEMLRVYEALERV